MSYSTSIKSIGLLFLSVLFLSGCGMMNQPLPATYETIPVSTKSTDIPIYKAGHQLQGKPYIFWNFCKQKQKQLELESPETSSDSLIYRIWITNQVGARAQPHALLEIQKDTSGWHGQLVLMHVDFYANSIRETIRDSKIYTLKPAHLSWDSIAFKLAEFKYDSLPTDDDIPGYHANEGYDTNTPTFSFEYATQTQYRFYQYADIYRVPDKFWQAQNVIDILDLLDKEFHWNKLGRSYFNP